jgi:hypothetical protein
LNREGKGGAFCSALKVVSFYGVFAASTLTARSVFSPRLHARPRTMARPDVHIRHKTASPAANAKAAHGFNAFRA